jgi:hypothetical protein
VQDLQERQGTSDAGAAVQDLQVAAVGGERGAGRLERGGRGSGEQGERREEEERCGEGRRVILVNTEGERSAF